MKKTTTRRIHIHSVILTLFIMGFISLGSMNVLAWDNCPFGETDEPYPGSCGRYIDTDKDNICDLSQPSPAERSNIIEEKTDSLQEAQTNVAIITNTNTAGINYYFIPIAFILFVFYLITLQLSKKKKMKNVQHKKLWNMLLLSTFLVSGIFGIILAILISYGIRLSFYADLLFWHVEFGIAMAMISIFHIAWHWKYYRKIIMKSS
jgi:hypothetical protein